MDRKMNTPNSKWSSSSTSKKVRIVNTHTRPNKIKFSQAPQYQPKSLYRQPAEYKVPDFLKELWEAK